MSIQEGVLLEDGKTSPAKARKIRDNLIEITIHEGKNRIIRRMMEKLGYRLRSIERIKIGKLGLGDLNPGKFRKLNKKEKEDIFR